MIGFVCGILATLGVVKLCSHGRWHHHHHRGRRVGARGPLRWLFRRLDTTHGQEKVVIEAAEEVQAALRDARDQVRRSFETVGQALREEEFSHERIADAWVRQDDALEKVRLALSTNLQSVHAALDARQRRELADLIEHGPRACHAC